MLSETKIKELKGFASEIRTECINMIAKIGVGHIGGCLSIADVLACLYGGLMKIDPANPRWEDRDRLILSKGHAGPAMYAALGIKGYFSRELFDTLNRPGTNLPSHTDMQLTPGIDMTTGSLGQGASSGTGIALAGKLLCKKYNTFIILGDGECQEGQVWESVIFAAAQKLDNLIVFIDYNKKQIDCNVDKIIVQKDFTAKFASFGWNTVDVNDGNDVKAIWSAVEKARESNGKPTAIILHTVKGKGWSVAEKIENNHNFKVDLDQAKAAAAEFAAQVN